MATVTITIPALIINLASDLSQKLILPYGSGLSSQPIVTVASSVYADGGSRMTRTPGYQTKLSATAQAVTEAQRLLMEYDVTGGGWMGESVWVRDFRGRKFFGYWDPPQIAQHDYDTESDITLSFTQVTQSEAV